MKFHTTKNINFGGNSNPPKFLLLKYPSNTSVCMGKKAVKTWPQS